MHELTGDQRAAADERARCVLAVAAELTARATEGVSFVSIRDARAAAKQAGVEAPDWRAERDMVRRAGFGRFKTAALLGEWETLVNATEEASRWSDEAVDLVAVSRASLSWCLADRPSDDPIAALATLSRDIATDDVHDERLRPSYARLLSGWRTVLG